MCSLGSLDILDGHAQMGRTAAVDEFEFFFRNLLCHPGTQVAVRDKQDLVIVNVFYNADSRG